MPPVAVSAGATCVASVFMPQGHYARDASYFFDNARRGPAGPRQREEGGNGVFRYGGSGFPTATSSSANYWVDVVFDVTNNVAPTVVGTFPAAGLQSVSRTSPVEVTFSEGGTRTRWSSSLALQPARWCPASRPTTHPRARRVVHGVGDAAGPGRPHRQGRVGPGFLGRLPHYAVLVELLHHRPWHHAHKPVDTSATPPASSRTWRSSSACVSDPRSTARSRRCASTAPERCPGGRPPLGFGWQPAQHRVICARLTIGLAAGQPAGVGGHPEEHHLCRVLLPPRRPVPGHVRPGGRRPYPLHAPASTPALGNGVFRHGSPGFPISTFDASNYWADAVFRVPPDVTAPVIANAFAPTSWR